MDEGIWETALQSIALLLYKIKRS